MEVGGFRGKAQALIDSRLSVLEEFRLRRPRLAHSGFSAHARASAVIEVRRGACKGCCFGHVVPRASDDTGSRTCDFKTAWSLNVVDPFEFSVAGQRTLLDAACPCRPVDGVPAGGTL